MPSRTRPASRRPPSAHRAATIPPLDAFFAWAQTTERKLSSRSALAEALRYMIKRRTALSRFATDARLEADNNIAENAIRCIAMRHPFCPSSSSLWKHWKSVFRRDATRAICSGNRVNHPFVLQVGSPDLIGAPGTTCSAERMLSLISRRTRWFVTPSVAAASDIVSHSPFFSAER